MPCFALCIFTVVRAVGAARKVQSELCGQMGLLGMVGSVWGGDPGNVVMRLKLEVLPSAEELGAEPALPALFFISPSSA